MKEKLEEGFNSIAGILKSGKFSKSDLIFIKTMCKKMLQATENALYIEEIIKDDR